MKEQLCKNCIHYCAYYKQRMSGYEKLNYGVCTIYKQERKRTEVCEKFKYDELKRKRREASLYFELEQAAKSINDIVHIIKENIQSMK